MLKEIYEQPEALRERHARPARGADATAHFGGLNLDDAAAAPASGASSSPPAAPATTPALVGEYLFEEFARIPVEVEYASEFRYRNPPIDTQHDRHRHHAVGRDGRHARRRCARSNARATRRWRSATSSAAPSPARPTAASTCTPGRRSAWPAPRRSRPRSPVLAMLALYLGRHAAPVEHERQGARGHRAARPRTLIGGLLDCHERSTARSPSSITTASNFLYLGRHTSSRSRWRGR